VKESKEWGVGGRIDERKNDKEAGVSGPTEVQSGSGRAKLRGAGCVRVKTASEGGRGAQWRIVRGWL